MKRIKRLLVYFVCFSIVAITTSVNAYYLYKSNSYLIDGVVVANSSTVNNNTIVTYVNCGKLTYPLIMETQSNEANIIVVPKDTAQYKAFTINIPIDKAAQYKIGKTYKFEKINMADDVNVVFMISFIFAVVCIIISVLLLVIIFMDLWINNN